MIYRFDILSSTNDEACGSQYKQGDIIVAESQTAGRGQRGHTWESGKGQNLTLSAVLEPTFLPPTEQFLLSEVIALAVADTLASYSIKTKIKWTNDIYVGDRKLVGILMEHKLQGAVIGRTIAGIGLNVNQTEFAGEGLTYAGSLRGEFGVEVDKSNVLTAILEHFRGYYEVFCKEGSLKMLQKAYETRLANYGKKVNVLDPKGAYQGVALGINDKGELLVRRADGMVEEVYAGEVSVRGLWGYV